MRASALVLACLISVIAITHTCYSQWRLSNDLWNYGEYKTILIYNNDNDIEIVLVGEACGVYRSTDHGVSWEKKKGIYGEVTSMVRYGKNIIASGFSSGILRSTNDGDTWERISLSLAYDSVRCLAVMGGKIYAGTQSSGVFLSSNGGLQWVQLTSGLPSGTIPAMQVHGNALYCAVQTPGSLYRLNETGDMWENVATLGTGYHIWSFLITENVWLVGTGGFLGAIYISNDGGFAWRASGNEGGMNLCYQIVLHDNIIWAAGHPSSELRDNHIIRSTDYGDKWAEHSDGIMYPIHAFGIGHVNMIAAGRGGYYYRPLSEITSIRHTENTVLNSVISSLEISPHPVSNHFSVDISLAKRAGVVVRISDLLGRVIHTTGPVEYDSGTHRLQYDLSTHPNGIYICHVTADDEMRSISIVRRQ